MVVLSKVKVIERNLEARNRKNVVNIEKLRVAPYIRVSTDSEEQLLSYKSQIMHYREMIESKEEWELAEVYADEGISGTQINNRISFKKMINDALDGKIDLVITKSISRFARNTLDTLKYVRLLKEKNVGIIFEKENINTLTMNGELLLVILSSLAQQESESISANIKMGLKMKMKRGELVGFQGCLGYDYSKESKTISLNDEEAVIVKYIFNRYLSGIGSYSIAQELMVKGYKTKLGNTEWGSNGVLKILKNEKYKGDLLLGKSFTVDPITHRRLENFGEEEKFYVEDHHEPIVSKESFDDAQRILLKRGGGRRTKEKGNKRKYTRKYSFSSMMKCGFCGSTITRSSWHTNTKNEKTVWKCSLGSKKGKMYCENFKAIKEKDIEKAFVESFNKMSIKSDDLVVEFLETIEESINSGKAIKKLQNLKDEMKIEKNKVDKLVSLNINDIITTEVYESKYHKIKSKIDSIEEEVRYLEVSKSNQEQFKNKMNLFKDIFENEKQLIEFDREIFENVIEQVVIGKVEKEAGIKNPYSITFVFKTGLEMETNCSTKKLEVTHDIAGISMCNFYEPHTCGVFITTQTKEIYKEVFHFIMKCLLFNV